MFTFFLMFPVLQGYISSGSKYSLNTLSNMKSSEGEVGGVIWEKEENRYKKPISLKSIN